MKSHIGFLIKSINDKIKVHADADLKSHGLTLAQSRILIYLTQRGGRATQKEVEDFLKVSHPTVVGLISRMEKSGILTFWQDDIDRRNKIIQLSDKAIDTGKDMDLVIDAMEKKMLRPLTDNQIEELTELLEIVYQNLEQNSL